MRKFLKIIILYFCLTSITFGSNFSDVEDYINVNEYSLALEELKKISPSSKEEFARQSYFIGEIYFALGNVTKSEEFFEDANMKSPANPKYASAYAKAMMALGKFNESRELANSVLSDDFNTVEAHIVIATIDERLGNVSSAKKRFEKLISLQPQSEIMHVAYAEFLDLRVNSWDAVELLREYIKRYPQSPNALNALGKIYSYLNNESNALKYRSMAAEIFQKKGQQIYADSIFKWSEEYEKNLNSTELIEEQEFNSIEISQTELQKPSLKYQNPNLIEPWPVDAGEFVYTGSGFITNNGIDVITNKHVVEGAKRLYVRNGYGELRSAEIFKLSDTDDVAVLRLTKKYDDEISIDIPANYPIKTGSDAYVMGYPLSDILGENKPSITQGIVSKNTGMNDDPGTFQITAKLNQGNSGGPIFSREGNILGIAVAKIDKTLMLQEEGMIPEDVNFGIPSKRIELLTEKSSDKIYSEDLDLEILYEMLLPSVVMILNVTNDI